MNADDLIYCGVNRGIAPTFVEPINDAMDRYLINTPARRAMFLANALWETGWLRYMRELWGPTPAQLTYDARQDLGNRYPGDGQKYRGGGLMMLTGRFNFAECGAAIGVDLVTSPEFIAQPPTAAKSGAWFWFRHGLNAIADLGDFERSVRIINGGLNGFDQRVALYTKTQHINAAT